MNVVTGLLALALFAVPLCVACIFFLKGYNAKTADFQLALYACGFLLFVLVANFLFDSLEAGKFVLPETSRLMAYAIFIVILQTFYLIGFRIGRYRQRRYAETIDELE